MNIKDCPPIQVKVLQSYLYQNYAEGYENGTLIALRVQQNQAFQFTVLLESGALFTGIPIDCICGAHRDALLPLEIAQAYDSIGEDIEIIEHQILRLMNCSVKLNNNKFLYGQYLFTVEFRTSGLARHPEQWKQFHIISTEKGFVVYPQYRIIFKDDALCPLNKQPLPKYRENKVVHVAE